MKTKLTTLLALTLGAWTGFAAVPPAEKLLPADTLAVLTVPDLDKATQIYHASATSQFWKDPAMKAFREKFEAKFKEEYAAPLERELGIKLADYSELARGQMTIAITRNGWEGKTNQMPGWLVIIDTKDKQELLKTRLAELKSKWRDAGKTIKTETIRGLDFSTVTINPDEFKKKKSAGGESKDSAKTQVTIGQSDSLLLMGNVPTDIEKVLIRQSGGLLPALAELPEFEANANAMFRDAYAFLWGNSKVVIDLAMAGLADESKGGRAGNPLAPKPDKILGALGLTTMKTIALTAKDFGDGSLVNLFLGVPAANRKGIFKVMGGETKDAFPPAFVAADATKFSRWRLDGRKLWTAIEGIVAEISPELSGVLQMSIDAAGKDKNPDFDLKKQLIGNLGDDIISFQKAPRGSSLADLSSPPTLYLIGSPNTEQAVDALKTALAIFGSGPDGLKDREFVGRKVYTLKLPPERGAGGKRIERSLNFSQASGYLAISSDIAILEEFLRGTQGSGKALSETPGLREAAEKVGGSSTGWFTFENQGESMRIAIESMKQNPELLAQMFGNPVGPVGTMLGAPGGGSDSKGMKEWFDVALLPSYDKIAKYFHYTVSAGVNQPDGFSFRTYLPNPPGLKK